MTDERPTIEFLEELELKAKNELHELIMHLAFAIDDPCGEEEIRLAKALINMARLTAPSYRRTLAIEIETACETLCGSQNPSSSPN
jgi:hypothetical protein